MRLVVANLLGLSLLVWGTAAGGAEPSPFALRDPHEGSRSKLTPKQERQLEEGMAALRTNDLEKASKRFRSGASSAKDPAPFQLGALYVQLVAGRHDEAAAELEKLLQKDPEYIAALEVRADLLALRESWFEALDAYRALSLRLPSDPRLKSRIAEMKRGVSLQRQAEARQALEAHELDGARRAALALVALEPQAPEGYKILSQTAEESGNPEDAYVWAERAHALDPGDREWAVTVAELAMKSGRFADAVSLYDGLSAGDPMFADLAEEARLEFKIQNLPERARRAALSVRLTRSQLAVLCWWFVPEVQDALVPNPPEVAIDVVDRTDRPELVRAISLGLLAVSRESHRANPEAPVSRLEFCAVVRMIAAFVGQGRILPPCLRGDAAGAAPLVECGILSDATSRSVGGKEAVGAIERAARAGREGGPR
ncbi:MAG: tetratricopeptide repeat protein [Thermoanaerobaculia bacterium]